jgi:hypothetical protein
MGQYSTTSTRRSYEVDIFGQVKRFAPNGVTVIYQSYTTGREKGFSKTGVLQWHKEPDGKFTRYRPDGITALLTNYTAGRTVY